MKKKDTNKVFKALRIVKNIVLVTAVLVLSAVIVLVMYSRITGNTPSLFGYSMYRVSSGSMEPQLKVGDVIISQACDGSEVQVGEIITYLGNSGDTDGKMVTHRVVEAPYDKNGDIYLVTKGDANIADDQPIASSQVQGRFVVKSSVLTFLYDIFMTPWGLVIIIVLIILAFFNEIIVLIKAVIGIDCKENNSESVEEIIERYKEENKTELQSDSQAESDDESSGGIR